MNQWKPVAVTCGMAMLGLVVATSSHAWGARHANTLTFEENVTLPGIVLPAGAYSFDLAEIPDLVVVRSADRGETVYIGFTHPVRRPQGASTSASVALGEAPANEPAPIAVWYPTGESVGHEFR